MCNGPQPALNQSHGLDPWSLLPNAPKHPCVNIGVSLGSRILQIKKEPACSSSICRGNTHHDTKAAINSYSSSSEACPTMTPSAMTRGSHTSRWVKTPPRGLLNGGNRPSHHRLTKCTPSCPLKSSSTSSLGSSVVLVGFTVVIHPYWSWTCSPTPSLSHSPLLQLRLLVLLQLVAPGCG